MLATAQHPVAMGARRPARAGGAASTCERQGPARDMHILSCRRRCVARPECERAPHQHANHIVPRSAGHNSKTAPIRRQWKPRVHKAKLGQIPKLRGRVAESDRTGESVARCCACSAFARRVPPPRPSKHLTRRTFKKQLKTQNGAQGAGRARHRRGVLPQHQARPRGVRGRAHQFAPAASLTRDSNPRFLNSATSSPWRAMSVRLQGLTLVHFSAQLERCSWDRGCA